jgi:hypothetical protein
VPPKQEGRQAGVDDGEYPGAMKGLLPDAFLALEIPHLAQPVPKQAAENQGGRETQRAQGIQPIGARRLHIGRQSSKECVQKRVDKPRTSRPSARIRSAFAASIRVQMAR